MPNVPPYLGRDRCPERRVVRNNRVTAPTRNSLDSTAPYIISPRNSLVLSDRPWFRWNAVAGVTTYRVEIPRLGWQVETTDTQIRYLGETLLEPGRRYRLLVEADNGKTSRQGDEVTGFTLVDASIAQQVNSQIAQLEQQELSQESLTLAIAFLYLEYDLQAEAVEVLTGAIARGIESVSIDRLLGEVYYQSGLAELARSSFEKALMLARSLSDLEAQALTLSSLGKVEQLLGNPNEAIAYLEQAQTNYQQLGDEMEVQQLEEAIEEIR